MILPNTQCFSICWACCGLSLKVIVAAVVMLMLLLSTMCVAVCRTQMVLSLQYATPDKYTPHTTQHGNSRAEKATTTQSNRLLRTQNETNYFHKINWKVICERSFCYNLVFWLCFINSLERYNMNTKHVNQLTVTPTGNPLAHAFHALVSFGRQRNIIFIDLSFECS